MITNFWQIYYLAYNNTEANNLCYLLFIISTIHQSRVYTKSYLSKSMHVWGGGEEGVNPTQARNQELQALTRQY